MTNRVYKIYNFEHSDLRNFLILLGAEFKRRQLELIPDGLILKEPKENETQFGNTSIDLIGIPFKKVYGRTRLNYYRIKLSEFEEKYRTQLGTAKHPVRTPITNDMEDMEARVKEILSKRLKIPEANFVVKHTGKNEQLITFSFKFAIPVTEFTTEDNGLCLVNDKLVTIYVAEPNIKIQNGIAVIQVDDPIEQRLVCHTSIKLKGQDPNETVYSTSGTFPDEYKLQNVKESEYFPEVIENVILDKPLGVAITGNISDAARKIAASITITDNGSIKGNEVYAGIGLKEKAEITITTKSGKKYIEVLEPKVKPFTGKMVVDPLYGNLNQSSSLNIAKHVRLILTSKPVDYKAEIDSYGLNTSTSLKVTSLSSKQYKVRTLEYIDTLISTAMVINAGIYATIKTRK